MSAGQSTRFVVHHVVERNGFRSFELFDQEDGRLPVDYFRTLAAAEHACRLLNAGAAVINPHAVLGCKVEAR